MTIIYSPFYDRHNMKSHVENKGRTDAIIDAISGIDGLEILEPAKANMEDILRVHSKDYIEYVKGFAERGGGYLDYDTYMNPESYNVALLAAGGAIKASEIILHGGEWAYSVARPPGHHATRDRAMGFCIFNNLAIALEYLREKKGIKRYLIIDFDVHYGNGTAEIFYDDPDVMYISIHQDPRTLFPGRGFIDEMGTAKGSGYTMNIPLQPNSNTDDYIWILEKILGVIQEEFKPQIIFFEAGFDAHQNDPLSNMMVDEEFYEWIPFYMGGNKIIAILEGGYDPKALAASNLYFVKSLMGVEIFKEREMKVSENTKLVFSQIRDKFSPFFNI